MIQFAAVTRTMERAARRRDHTGVGQGDIEFHRLLVSLAGSPRLSRMHDTLLTEARMCIHALAVRGRQAEAGAPAAGAHMEDAITRRTAAAEPSDEVASPS